MRGSTIPAMVVSLLLVLTGCAASNGSGSDDVTPAASAERADLAFSGETLDGATFEGEQLAGKPAVLWFWAPWCPTCRAQAAGVSALAGRYAGEVNVVGVGGLAGVADIRDFAAKVSGPTHLIDPDGAVWRHFGVTAQSVYVVIDAEGAVVAEGYLEDEDLADEVAGLVG